MEEPLGCFPERSAAEAQEPSFASELPDSVVAAREIPEQCH